MAPLYPFPDPDRPVVANLRLGHSILRPRVALNKKFHEACRLTHKIKLIPRVLNFPSQTISPAPCFYLLRTVQSFVYRIAGVAHR
jgi:hypothetical protein